MNDLQLIHYLHNMYMYMYDPAVTCPLGSSLVASASLNASLTHAGKRCSSCSAVAVLRECDISQVVTVS